MGRICVLGKVESLSEGKGNAAGRKVSVVISYQTFKDRKEETVHDRVDFWNSRDLQKPQLADRARELQIGQFIVALISIERADHCCLAFMTKEGVFSFGEGTRNEMHVVFGSALLGQETDISSNGQNYHVFRIGVPVSGKWQNVTFFEQKNDVVKKARRRYESATMNHNRVVAVTGSRRISKGTKGSDVWQYNGFRLFEVRDHDEDPLINIGQFAVKPARLSFLKKEADDKEIFSKMRYAVYEWMPESSDPEELKRCMKQKALLGKLLEEKNK